MTVQSNGHSGISYWRLYSQGIVAENKPRSTNNCLVVPYEVFPMMDGELGDEEESLEVEGVDWKDQPIQLKVKSRPAILCKWYPHGSNRQTAPDVRKGERVEIYRFGDSDTYYWVPTGLDDHLRRLETVRFLFNADPDGLGNDPPSPDNCYCVEISTHDRLITITTTKINEEPFAYTIQLNTKEGYFVIKDDVDNYAFIDSKDTLIRLQNAAGSSLELNKEDLIVDIPRDIRIKAIRDIFISCRDLLWEAGQKMTFKAASEFIAESPVFKFKGNFELEGDHSVSGKQKVEGTSEFKGAMKAAGITSDKPIKGPSATI